MADISTPTDVFIEAPVGFTMCVEGKNYACLEKALGDSDTLQIAVFDHYPVCVHRKYALEYLPGKYAVAVYGDDNDTTVVELHPVAYVVTERKVPIAVPAYTSTASIRRASRELNMFSSYPSQVSLTGVFIWSNLASVLTI